MLIYILLFFIQVVTVTGYAEQPLIISSKSIQGLSENRQDYAYIEQNINSPVISILCDGHGSYGDFIAETVAHDLQEYLNQAMFNTDKNNNIQIIKKAFIDINTKLKKGIGSNGQTSGTTCIVLLLINNDFYIAYAGDCRAVWGMDENQQTKDHTGHNEAEVLRIGADKLVGPQKRVGGKLCVTRSFGDFDLANHGITAEPEVIIISRAQVDFIILGSDGLWDGASIKRTKNATQTNDNRLIYSLLYNTVIENNESLDTTCNRIIAAAICSTLINRKKPLLNLFNMSKNIHGLQSIINQIGPVTPQTAVQKIDPFKKELILALPWQTIEKFIEENQYYAHDNTTIICVYNKKA